MVNAFNRSEWVASSESRIVSRGATSCAGMTAHHVLLARNKIGFLTGGRSSKLEDKEQEAQKEEAFARARVALTCAQRFCFLMCPLDMKGLIGTGTVVGSLQHGAGICEQIAEENPLILLRPPAMKLFYSCSQEQERSVSTCSPCGGILGSRNRGGETPPPTPYCCRSSAPQTPTITCCQDHT